MPFLLKLLTSCWFRRMGLTYQVQMILLECHLNPGDQKSDFSWVKMSEVYYRLSLIVATVLIWGSALWEGIGSSSKSVLCVLMQCGLWACWKGLSHLKPLLLFFGFIQQHSIFYFVNPDFFIKANNFPCLFVIYLSTKISVLNAFYKFSF